MASPTTVMFSKFNVTNAVFHTTALTFCIVNIKPLLPGHVLVCPRRVTARLADLSAAESADLMRTVQQVSRMLERVYCQGAAGAGLNVAMQDGRAAGQSVPHVHMHLIPRRPGDLPEDAVYGMLEGEPGDVARHWAESLWRAYRDGRGDRPTFDKTPEADRRNRTDDEMRDEAQKLKKELDRERDEFSPELFEP